MSEEKLAKSIKYFEVTGMDVVLMSGDIAIAMSPGSAYDDLTKEKLPEKYSIPFFSYEASFSKNFIEQFRMTHRVDLDRLLRALSILLTGFNGPITDDYPKKHHMRFFSHFMLKDRFTAEEEILQGLMTFGRIYGVDMNKLGLADWVDASRIVNKFYALCVDPV